MLPITFAALCVAVISAESSSVSTGYSSNPSNARDYEYSGASYHGGNNKPTQYAAEAYITTGGGSPYAKSDSRYSVESSNSDSTDPRASATNSFYKTKYGNEAVINSLRPTAFHTSSSSSSNSPSSSSSSGSSDQLNPSHYSSSDYSSGSSHPSSSSSSSGSSQYEGASSSAAAADYTAMAYGDRSPSEHHHQQHHHSHISGPVYSSAAAAELAATGVSTGPSEYSTSGRPSGPPVYTREYSGSSGLGEYTHQSRPTSYSHGSPSSFSASEYPSPQHAHPQYHHHHHQPQHAAYTNDEYPSQPAMHSVPTHPYKTYVMSSPGPSSYPAKYQSVFGALKSFFGGGSDAAPSATHVSSYPSGPSYYSSPSMMHAAAAAHHPSPSPYSGMPSAAAMSSGPGYYFGPGPSASNSIYSKSYPSMRFVSGYGSGGAGSSPGSKIIVVRDSSGALHGPGYPSGATSGLIGSPSSYMTKSKLSAFAPAGPGHAYISSVSPSSLQAYASGPPSSSYPGYSSSPSFSSSGHGGSTFLGYSA